MSVGKGRSGRAKKHAGQIQAARSRQQKRSQTGVRVSLPSHRRKLARAETHIQEVERIVKAWVTDSNAYKIAVETNSDGHVEVFGQQLKPLPGDLELIIGDALQAMRSSLENLAFALAIKNTPAMTPKEEADVSFPIFDTPPQRGAGTSYTWTVPPSPRSSGFVRTRQLDRSKTTPSGCSTKQATGISTGPSQLLRLPPTTLANTSTRPLSMDPHASV